MRVILRTLLRLIGRGLLFLLARIEIYGRENFPTAGPLILAGNHVGVMEVVMMAIYPPYPLEFIGSGDIPLDPKFAWLANLWGYIPINRGNLDRAAIRRGVEILRSSGVVVVFPEGGIWNPGEMNVRNGIALLSGMSNAPVLPIGFGGIQGALKAILRLQRPKLVMNVGEMLPAVQLDVPGLRKKEALVLGSQEIWSQIQRLVPEQADPTRRRIEDERFTLAVCEIASADERCLDRTAEIPNPDALARFLLHPIIMDIFHRNLKLNIEPLIRAAVVRDPAQIIEAVETVLHYLTVNQGFLTYRFGMKEGLAMHEGLEHLHRVATDAKQSGNQLRILPTRVYFNGLQKEEIVENLPGKAHQY